jgi:hypothetical protein
MREVKRKTERKGRIRNIIRKKKEDRHTKKRRKKEIYIIE